MFRRARFLSLGEGEDGDLAGEEAWRPLPEGEEEEVLEEAVLEEGERRGGLEGWWGPDTGEVDRESVEEEEEEEAPDWSWRD